MSLGQDWLVFQDLLQQRISLSQDYSVMPYLPYLSVLFHFLYASSAKPQIKYPSNSYEVSVWGVWCGCREGRGVVMSVVVVMSVRVVVSVR